MNISNRRPVKTIGGHGKFAGLATLTTVAAAATPSNAVPASHLRPYAGDGEAHV